jgi:hypothetical protein
VAFFRKIKAGLVKDDIESFVGEQGNIFFNVETGELRLSDGSTPGGVPIIGSAGAIVSETEPTNPNEGDIWYKESTNELSVFGGIWTSVGGAAGNLEGPLVWATDGSYRTLVGYRENNITQTIRRAEFSNNLLRITLATFTPVISATNLPSNSLNWDVASQGFSVSVTNPDDISNQYISSVASITASSGSISSLSNFTAGAYSSNPAGTVDWTQTFSTNGSSYIRPVSSTITGGSASAVVAFNYYNGSSEVSYTSQNASFTVNWATPTVTMSLANLTGLTFLASYSTTTYTIAVTGINNNNNVSHSVSSIGGTVSSATASGTFTFTDPIHKNNTVGTRLVSTTTTLTRPSQVTGTGYSVQVVASASNPSATFTYPTVWVWTASANSIPTRTSFVSGTGFAAGVTVLGNQVRTLSGFINNTEAVPRVFWFAVRSAASQPTIFRTGASAVLLSDVSVISGNTVGLAPDNPPNGYNNESYTLYGITLQPGNTYVSIS